LAIGAIVSDGGMTEGIEKIWKETEVAYIGFITAVA
jgi:hypothetical protein